MNDSVEAPGELRLEPCWNGDGRLAVVVGPDGEPLCEVCAVKLAREIEQRQKRARRALKRVTRLQGCASSIRSRNL